MIHSGSRHIGYKTGDYFNTLAQRLNEKWHSQCSDIPFLPVDTEEGQAYLVWLDFSLRFAYLNRKIMMDEVKNCLRHEFPEIQFNTEEVIGDTVDGTINVHHNFCQQEHHFGKDWWVFRKGATMARANQTGIIPGSMDTSSYITNGLNNAKSLNSSSHGSGRKIGRMAFNRKMKNSYAQIEKSLEGVVHSEFKKVGRGKNKDLLDVSECGFAYKNIESVMEAQRDLVEIKFKLKPLVCLKG